MTILSDFEVKLSAFPPVGIVTTPLQPLIRLSSHMAGKASGPTLWVKRDDATHISCGGNKMRKLDRVLRAALDQGCDTLVSGGVAQSNSQRQVATAAAMLGLECHLAVYQGRVATDSPLYDVSGNVVLNHLLGASCHAVEWTGDRNGAIQRLADKLTAQGKRPFIIPYGVSNAMGALSYSSVIAEIAEQSANLGFTPDVIIASTGSGGTQAGLCVGVQACLPTARVVGFDVDAEPDRVRKDAVRYGTQAAARLGTPFEAEQVEVQPGFSGAAYGDLPPQTRRAMELTARLEGIILDPVYTGKAMAGLLDWISQGRFASTDHIVFVHTGGLPATFAYADKIIAGR